ncbi:MAG: hypothetical protein JNL18_02655 [Planctomycetaceae bacterium]|nr:hypothetical protein [Planctomycetaceae bacterium]
MPTNTETTTTPQSAWQVVAELPYGGSLTTVHQQVRTLRHLVVDPYDASQDNAIHFALRGYRFRMEQVDDRLDFWVNDGSCPVEILMEPLCHLVKTLAIKRETPVV